MLIDGPATAASGAAIEQVGEGTDHAIWVGVPGNWLSLGGRAIGGGGAAVLN